jgi:uncharacterized membrane protein
MAEVPVLLRFLKRKVVSMSNSKKNFRSVHVALRAVVLWFAAGLLFASSAQATEWKICNATSEDVDVVIVYGTSDGRQYVSKGWWLVPANGGCRVVFSGNLPVSGVFLRGEGVRGDRWEGDTLFCTTRVRFEMGNANSDEAGCRRRGAELQAFQMHTISAQHFTTTLRPRGGIDHRID